MLIGIHGRSAGLLIPADSLTIVLTEYVEQNIFLSVKHMTLKRARLKKGWRQEDLADASGVQQSGISKLERGSIVDPQKSTVDALEDALGLQRGTLVFGEEAIAS